MIAAPIITVDQAAELLGCEPGTLEAQLAGGRFPGVKYGRSWRIPADALHQHLTAEAMRHLKRSATPQPAAVAHPAKPARRAPRLVALP